MRRAVFLDRDGVINEAVVVGDKSFSPRSLNQFVFMPGIKEAVGVFKKKGYLVIVITNQPEIPRGLLDMRELDKMHAHVKNELGVDDILVCLHDDGDACDCRKPKPGMLIGAAKKWNIDLKKSFMIGDRWRDIEAGRAVGCKTILLKNNASGVCEPDNVVIDLNAAISLIN